jgi:hypothetical protein
MFAETITLTYDEKGNLAYKNIFMDTPTESGKITSHINMDEVRKHLEVGETFMLPIPMNDAQAVLEECGLIWSPKSETYQSLEEGDRWKVTKGGEDSITIAPAPILYDTGAAGTLITPPGGEREIEEDEEKLEGLTPGSASPEGDVMEGPKADPAS